MWQKYLDDLSSNENIVLPKVIQGNFHVWHLFVIRTKNRSKILKEYESHKVEFGIHYPLPIHRQNAYKEHKQYREKIKLADFYSSQLLSLPIFPYMLDEEINRVVETVQKYN